MKQENILGFDRSLGFGLGLRSPHYSRILEQKPLSIDWFEAITENYLGLDGLDGGKPLRTLLKIRESYPIVLHGVSLSIGSADPLNMDHVRSLAALAKKVQPAWISDHCCWTGVDGQNLHDLLPLPYTLEAINHVVDRVQKVQEALGRRILLENVSSYLSFSHSEMHEWDFLSEICRRADCGLLLDINNIYVSAINHSYDPLDFLMGIPVQRVGQFHLAGYSSHEGMLIDTHDHAPRPEVWALYEKALQRFGQVPTLLEWDTKIPEFEVLEGELEKARVLCRRVSAS